MKTVAIIAVDNCLSSVVYGVKDIFGIANRFIGVSKTYTPKELFNPIIVGTNQTVSSFSDITINIDQKIHEIDDVDYIIIAPISSKLRETVQQSTMLITWMKKMADRGAVLCSVCTGSFLLAQTGLLNNKNATTNPNLAMQFRKDYPKVNLDIDKLITDNGNIICCGATYAFVDLVIYLLEKNCGFDIAIECARNLVTDKNRVDQRPYISFQPRQFHHDKIVHSVQQRVHENYQSPLTLEDLASDAAVSVRNLTRRFKAATDQTPKSYLQSIRINKSKEMLETTDLSFEKITLLVGYEDVRSFSRLFAKKIGVSPKVYRERFQIRR
ncbi:MAG: helix-turn-helix domain-containing protein [Kangiellaceae bacterium]|nr:helix-turn-helix domain-containing protein [Kangiellaceae bacterium]